VKLARGKLQFTHLSSQAWVTAISSWYLRIAPV